MECHSPIVCAVGSYTVTTLSVNIRNYVASAICPELWKSLFLWCLLTLLIQSLAIKLINLLQSNYCHHHRRCHFKRLIWCDCGHGVFAFSRIGIVNKYFCYTYQIQWPSMMGYKEVMNSPCALTHTCTHAHTHMCVFVCIYAHLHTHTYSFI